MTNKKFLEVKVIKLHFPKKARTIRDKIVYASTQAAENYGGLDVCINKCSRSKEQWSGTRPAEMRCCSACSPQYMNMIPERLQEEIRTKLVIFPTNERGFWSPSGCRLPRTHRPEMCLTYRCSDMERYAPEATAILQNLYKKLL